MKIAIALFALAAALAIPTAAESATGTVFEDLNGNGERDSGEPGVEGVYVQAGASLARTDATGRYGLDESAEAGKRAGAANQSSYSPFVVVTRPRGFDSDVWYRRGAGDFALRRRPANDSDFLFVHMSDAHISDRAEDIGEYGIPKPIARMPDWLSGIAMWAMVRFQAPAGDREAGVAALRERLAPRHDTSRMSDTRLMGTWVGEVVDTPELVVDPASDFRGALAELRSMSPAFVVSTGDLVIESNDADAPTIDRWMKFYAVQTRATGLTFYDTIGNNELAGIENDDFSRADPGYGKGMFRDRFGPTFYSFDRGDFHFIALDTHLHEAAAGDGWNSQRMEAEVRNWLLADIVAHREMRIVVMNHEPFRGDPDWAIPDYYIPEAEDQAWLQLFNIPYTLSGHLHVSGTTSEGVTQHVMTGALSGARWTLPQAVYPRGYRLVQAHDGELFSAWKSLGEPVLGFVTPAEPGAPDLHATAPLEMSPELVVIVAADADGPFAEVTLSVDGKSVLLERWSDFFFAARLAGPADQASLRIEARTRQGQVLERQLGARTPPN